MTCKRTVDLAIAAALLLAGLLPAVAQEDEHEQELRQKEFLSLHRDPTGKVRPDLWRLGTENLLTMKAVRAPTGTGWLQIGPQPLRIDKQQNYQGAGPDSGEVVDIAINYHYFGDDKIVYIATNDGGIWKTSDGGKTWSSLLDFCPQCPSLSMGAVAQSLWYADGVYAGTGNPFDGGGLFTKGVGIYRSLDSGGTWTVLNPGGIFTNVAINRIALLTMSGFFGEIMLVATNSGLFRSQDFGDHFGNNPPNFDNSLPVLAGYISDVKVDTSSPSAVYAAVSGGGLYSSSDGGITFPTTIFKPSGSFTFISFAQSTKPNNLRFYASVAATNTSFLGLYRSDDGGGSWTKQNGTNLPVACQCGYDQTIGVDPQVADRVYVGFQELWLSTDGGNTFGAKAVTRNKVHWDHHALYFSPSTHWSSPPTRIWVGTDGGVASSKDGGTSWSNLNQTIATNLFKHIDVGRNSVGNIAYTYGGTQDTGTIEHRPDFLGNDWHLGVDSDGSGVAVDPADPKTAYGIQLGIPIYTVDGGDHWSRLPGSLPSAWRYAIDPNNSSNIFAIPSLKHGFRPAHLLYRSTDKGQTFNLIATFAKNVRTIANTPLNSSLIWLGLEDGSLQRCGNALGTPPGCVAIGDASGTGHPVGGIFIILTDPMSSGKDRVVATYEGFSGVTNPSKHLFYTEDSGASWKDISNTLPDLPTHSVYGSAAVSNDAGVMATTDLGSHWSVLGTGLPTVDSTQLAGGTCPPVLRIGTYGRSVFELNPSAEVGFYDNGPVDGKTFAWPINGGGWASNSFRATGSSMQGVTFAVWVTHTDVPIFVLWSVTDQPHAGNLCASGNATLTPTFLFTNPKGFDVYSVKFDTPAPVSLNVGATYFLNLEGLITKKVGPAFWDQNSGVMCKGSGTDLDGKGANCPSYGFSPGGSIPSETFAITTVP